MKWNKIFSCYEKRDGYYTKKITFICGVKFSRTVLEIKPILKMLEDKERHISRHANHNLLLYVIDCLRTVADDDLYCLKNECVCYIFNNKVLKWGSNNFNDFVINSDWALGKLLVLEKIDPATSFYAEFAERAAKGEFLWKFQNKGYVILNTVISFGADNAVYIDKSGIAKPNTELPKEAHFVTKASQRRFIEGQAIPQYIADKSYEEQKEVLLRLVEYVLDKYTLPSGQLSEVLADAHLNNFVIDTAGNFHLIDDDLVADKPLDKQYVLNRMMKSHVFRNIPLRQEICEHFGCKYTGDKLNSTSATDEEWQKLLGKYFTQC